MSASPRPRAPRGLGRSGKRLWSSIIEQFDLATHEQILLAEACRVADRLDLIADAMKDAPLTVENTKGDEVAQPLLVEARQQGIVYARLIAALRLPDDAVDAEGDGEQVSRPQRRGGARGTYGLRAVQ